jgi:hypothetical protein
MALEQTEPRPTGSALPNIVEATGAYENWLGQRLRLVPPDLERKHDRMGQEAFRFLRATFYRWMQRWANVAAEFERGPTVLAVGDLHVENFGMWRDAEGRLVWGINDFDEAHPLSWAQDLVRLATSAHLAVEANRLAVRRSDACTALLEGYSQALEDGGGPIILAEKHSFLRDIALGEPLDPRLFWKELLDIPALTEPAPAGVMATLEAALPPGASVRRVAHRVAGLGSLGRERYVVIADWRGGLVAREAKAVAPSACVWARPKGESESQYLEALLGSAVRAPDPFLRLDGGWLLRRLAPDCRRIELSKLPEERDEYRLLRAMGYETANVHLGTAGARDAIRAALKSESPDWLHRAAKTMGKAVEEDWDAWKRRKRAP